MPKLKGKYNFTLKFDELGNLCSTISNGVIALTAKIDKANNAYQIRDVKTGLTIINKKFKSEKLMRIYMRKDVITILDTYTSSEKYDTIFKQNIMKKYRGL